MSLDNIDDLFRDKLDGHTTPPGDALWARLQAGASPEPAADANAERLDQLFQQKLSTHATPPRRELWERLEDEHLRSRKRRPAAWWPMALAAALALLLVAGGAGLWLGFPSGNTQTGTLASQQQRNAAPKASSAPNAGGLPNTEAEAAAKQETLVAANTPQPAETVISESSQINTTAQATRLDALASTAPKARMSAPGQSTRHLKGTNRQPDAATEQAPLMARTTTRPATTPALKRPTAADEQRPATEPVVATTSKPAPAPEIVPARAVPAPSLASAGELITVDVKNGAEPGVRPNTIASLTTIEEAPEERRRLGGRLLQQAGNLVRGERVNLAEAAGLPENVTVRATIAGRTLTKSIQL